MLLSEQAGETKICLLGREYTILFIAIEEMKRKNFTFIQSIES